VSLLVQAEQASVQASSQQTWSEEQKPVPHSPAPLQASPFNFFVLHVPLVQ
jgi:hypothetical protein